MTGVAVWEKSLTDQKPSGVTNHKELPLVSVQVIKK